MNDKKLDVLALEPDLTKRKAIAALFPMKNYYLKFIDDFSQFKDYFETKIPHFILVNLDFDFKKNIQRIESLYKRTPKEVFIFAMTEKPDNRQVKYLATAGIKSVFPLPLNGGILLKQLRSYVKELRPIEMMLEEPAATNIISKGEIVGIGETSLVIKTGVKPEVGEELNLDSSFLNKMFDTLPKVIASENKNLNIKNPHLYLFTTFLGIKNADLKAMRSKILHWVKI